MPHHSHRLSSNFSLLVKPAGADCNLACEYCFYLSKGKFYPNSSSRMRDEVLQEYIRQLLASQTGQEVNVAWQGGEPTLMGLDFFKRSVELVNENRRPDQKVSYALQTNGTLLNDDWCAFFKENHFLIGLSLDGPEKMHNAYRFDKGGKGSFDRARQGWDMLQKHEVDTNILCAVNAANVNHPLEVYHFFRDGLKAQFIQFIPIVEQGPLRSGILSEPYGSFLIEIFDEWVRRDVGKIFVQIFDSALASWCGLWASVCVFQETCGQSLVMEHNGDVYSCDHFVTPENLLGNIHETTMNRLAASANQQRFGMDKRDKLPTYCKECDVLFACHGECPKNRFARTPDGKEGLNYLCAGYRMFFRHIDRPMQIIADLLSKGRAAEEIMSIASNGMT
jgi:uncharacterized protein